MAWEPRLAGMTSKSSEGRKWTAFCGHEHKYVTLKRNGNDHIQLATTGGGSKMRGKEFGELPVRLGHYDR